MHHRISTGVHIPNTWGLHLFPLLWTLGSATHAEIPPENFKLAFLGDQGLGPNSEATLQLVKREKVDALVHLGDFDYLDNPAAWEDQTNRILGPDFPQIAVIGNHDVLAWPGTGGYNHYIQSRLDKMGVTVEGEAGVKCAFHYRGIFFVLTAPGLIGQGHAEFIRDQLKRDTSLWKISAWHVNQRLMQVGGKSDEAGWEVYEESRLGGAIIATAHEHSYSRTHLLSHFERQTVASKIGALQVRKGRTFAFVSGLGGEEVRPQLLSGNWWASIYTANQGALPGALFATFHVDGNPRKARFYFKNIDNGVVDSFEVYADSSLPSRPIEIPNDSILPHDSCPPPRNTQLRTLWLDPTELGMTRGGKIRILDGYGRTLAAMDGLEKPTFITLKGPGLVFLWAETKNRRVVRKIILLP